MINLFQNTEREPTQGEILKASFPHITKYPPRKHYDRTTVWHNFLRFMPGYKPIKVDTLPILKVKPMYPGIVVKITGEDSHPHSILARAKKAALRGGLSHEHISKYERAALGAGEYGLIAETAAWFAVE